MDCVPPKRESEDGGAALATVAGLPADVGFLGVLTGVPDLADGLTPGLGVLVAPLGRVTGFAAVPEVDAAGLLGALGAVLRVAEDALARLPADAAQASTETISNRLTRILITYGRRIDAFSPN